MVVFEANDYPGGKLSHFTLGKYRFDAGPSLFTMPHLVEELFELFDESPETHFSYKKKAVICRYFWEDGKQLTAYADREQFLNEVYNQFGIPQKRLHNYLKKSAKKYTLTAPLFLEKSLHKLSTYLSKDTIKAILNMGVLDLNNTLNEVNQKTIKEPHMVQFYNRFATYNGSSPYLTPGIMSMIPHLEQHMGTFFPKGGMHSITDSLYTLAKSKGVKFQFNKQVERIIIENKKAKGIEVAGETHKATIVVSNMDIVPTYRKLLPDQRAPEKILKQPRSSSALIFYWGIKKSFPHLDLHNIFFSKDYEAEFDAIFNQLTICDDPTVYINITSKEEKGDAPGNGENWFVMINTPGDTGQDWDSLIPKVRERVLGKLSRLLGESMSPLIEEETYMDPRLIASKTQSYQGSLYGASSNNKMAAFLRHPNFSSRIKGLYFCGGSVHPGGGIPLCLLSAKIVGDLVD